MVFLERVGGVCHCQPLLVGEVEDVFESRVVAVVVGCHEGDFAVQNQLVNLGIGPALNKIVN